MISFPPGYSNLMNPQLVSELLLCHFEFLADFLDLFPCQIFNHAKDYNPCYKGLSRGLPTIFADLQKIVLLILALNLTNFVLCA